jgi:hypothetical protein
MQTRVLLWMSFLVCSSYLSGQSHLDFIEQPSRPEALLAIFNQFFPDHHVRKIRGRSYVNPYLSAPEHQFFQTKNSLAGILHTVDDTIRCKDVFYDLHSDKLLVYVGGLHSFVAFDEAFIERFILWEKAGDQRFEFVKLTPGGFHEKIHGGDAYALYRKHSKIYRQRERQGRYYDGFDKYEQLIFRKDSSYIPVRKNRDLLSLFPEEAAALRKYLRGSRMNLKDLSDDQARALMQHLEETYPVSGLAKTEN